MSKAQIEKDALRLSPAERLEIADRLYSSLDPPPLSEAQTEMLKRRATEADEHFERFSPWDEAIVRLRRGVVRRREAGKA